MLTYPLASFQLWLDVHGALFRDSGSELVYLFDEMRPALEVSLKYMSDLNAQSCRLVCGLTRCPIDIPGQGSKSVLDALLDRRRQILVRGVSAGKFKCHMKQNEMDRRADDMYVMQACNISLRAFSASRCSRRSSFCRALFSAAFAFFFCSASLHFCKRFVGYLRRG